MINETGLGEPDSGRAPQSARIRIGPDPRISIRARGVLKPHLEAGHTTAPDPCSYWPKTSCIFRGVHTRPIDRHAGRGHVGDRDLISGQVHIDRQGRQILGA